MAQTPIPAAPSPPAIPTGRDVYDQLMAHIEPDLTTANAKTLMEKYKDETPDQRASRMKRYELAFERCDRSYNEYLQTLDTQVGRYRRDAFSHAELVDKSGDDSLLSGFTALFQQAA
jgi:hypothetical protein